MEQFIYIVEERFTKTYWDEYNCPTEDIQNIIGCYTTLEDARTLYNIANTNRSKQISVYKVPINVSIDFIRNRSKYILI